MTAPTLDELQIQITRLRRRTRVLELLCGGCALALLAAAARTVLCRSPRGSVN